MKTLTIGLLILVVINGQLIANEDLTQNKKITFNLDDTSEILVKGFIAPIGENLSETSFKEWDTLMNLRAAEPGEAVSGIGLPRFSSRRTGFNW